MKHAPGSSITVSLRADSQKRTVSLEVHDDGPGFDAAAARFRRGLQNMADRIDALGGILSVESAPGAGTWIRAEVPVKAESRTSGGAKRLLEVDQDGGDAPVDI